MIVRNLTTGLMAAAVLLAGGAAHAATHAGASWNPAITERLVKLPQSRLKTSLDRDFARSGLADAISNTEDEITLKVDTLGDLAKAAERAGGALKIELRHQLLAEKRAYLNLVKHRQDLRRRHLEQRRKVYKRILDKVLRAKGADTPERQDLIRNQEAAQARFQRSVEAVDMKVFAAFDAPDSRYAKEYARNLSAANALLQAINAHPMQTRDEPDTPKDKATFLRRLVAEADSRIALVTQEEEILGYMAKLVALDASALAEELATGAETAETDGESPSPVTSALSHFIR